MNLHGIPLAPLSQPRLDCFLLGYIAAGSAIIALFFLRFWKETRDFLFFAFAVFFIVHGGSRVFALSTQHPNLVVDWVYAVRLVAVLLLVAAIVRKNFWHSAE